LTLGDVGRGGVLPCIALAHRDWLVDITQWGEARRFRIGYDPSRYEMPALKWAQSSFILPQMMMHDRYFYDPAAGKYTVDKCLDD
jgi:iron(II)-dependent oxidoreductase